jgi:hypothetical protein
MEEEYLTATANKAKKEGENMARSTLFAFFDFVVGFSSVPSRLVSL